MPAVADTRDLVSAAKSLSVAYVAQSDRCCEQGVDPMPLAGLATVVLTIVIALAVASYLVRVVLILRAVNDSLGKVTFGVRAIAHQTAPLSELLGAPRLSGVGGSLTRDEDSTNLGNANAV